MFSEASERGSKEGTPSSRDERTSSPRGFRRGNNFSDLLQKFSSSDASGSEKSDTDAKSSSLRKVMSTVKVSVSSGLTRTESVGRSESERPKGILKRTPSLHKTGVNVDPELASILKNRRAKHDDVEEEAVTEKLTAEEDIRKSR